MHDIRAFILNKNSYFVWNDKFKRILCYFLPCSLFKYKSQAKIKRVKNLRQTVDFLGH